MAFTCSVTSKKHVECDEASVNAAEQTDIPCLKCNFEANKLQGRLNRITGFYQIKPALIRQYFAPLNNTVNF